VSRPDGNASALTPLVLPAQDGVRLPGGNLVDIFGHGG
jgi:hypothetical protein